MRDLIVILLCLVFFISCKSQNKQEKKSIILVGTKWECKITEGYINFIEFKEDSRYVSYSSEVDGFFYGNYTVKGNYVFLEQIKGGEHVKLKLRIKNGSMKYIERWELNVNNEWVKSDFKFDDAFSFKKVDK